MIDRASRDALAELARHFLAGRITNRELENSLPSSRDRAIRQIWWNALWGLYDDFHEHRLVGRYYIPRDSRADLARCILFLKTDLEYEWTPYPPEPRILTGRPFIASHSWRGESNHGSSLAAARRLKCLAVLSRGGLSRGARTTSVSRVRLLTIVGGVRERWVATRRGRGKTVCARGARRALLRGPSTSPLGGYAEAPRLRCADRCGPSDSAPEQLLPRVLG